MIFGWFTLLVILLMFELVKDKLITIWYVIGAMAALISTVYTSSIIIQLIVFIVVSLIAKVIIEKQAANLKNKKMELKNKTNAKKKAIKKNNKKTKKKKRKTSSK